MSRHLAYNSHYLYSQKEKKNTLLRAHAKIFGPKGIDVCVAYPIMFYAEGMDAVAYAIFT